jgi:hypothetical protein
MDLSIILSEIVQNGLHPVRAEFSGRGLREMVEIVSQEDLTGFIKAAKLLDQKVVFYGTQQLDESDFIDEEDLDDGTVKRIVLADFDDRINEYKKFVGEPGMVEISFVFQGIKLRIDIVETWFDEFLEIAEEIREGIKNQIEQKEKDKEIASERKSQEIIRKVNALKSDEQFQALAIHNNSTLRQVLAAVEQLVPEVVELDPNEFKAAVQDLRDRIKAKAKLGR